MIEVSAVQRTTDGDEAYPLRDDSCSLLHRFPDSFGRGVHGESPEIGVIEKVKKVYSC